jgi:glycerate kinase
VSAAPSILVAPDSFKGTFSAFEVTDAAAAGVLDAGGDADCCPVADGGEGTMAILLAAGGGTTTAVPSHDPLGRPIEARLGWLEQGATALVETAQASGLALVAPAERDAELASTFGTGELIAAAVAGGARRVIIAVGGSATTDGGAGAIEAIEQAAGLGRTELLVLCDVTTPFEDAARRFAAQKGADAEAIERLSERLQAQAVGQPRDPRGVPMTGAAGGLSGGLWARYGARLEPGAPWVLGAVGVTARLALADAVIVGEGRLDDQSFDGKIVGVLAARCRAASTPVYAIVGSSSLGAAEATRMGLSSVHVCPDLESMRTAGARVTDSVAEAALEAGEGISPRSS